MPKSPKQRDDASPRKLRSKSNRKSTLQMIADAGGTTGATSSDSTPSTAAATTDALQSLKSSDDNGNAQTPIFAQQNAQGGSGDDDDDNDDEPINDDVQAQRWIRGNEGGGGDAGSGNGDENKAEELNSYGSESSHQLHETRKMRDKDGEVLFAGYLHQSIASDAVHLMQAFFKSLKPILFIRLDFFDEEEGLVALPAGNIRKTDKPERAFGKALLTAKDINISFFRYVTAKKIWFPLKLLFDPRF